MKKLKFILLIDDDSIANYLNEIIIEEMQITEAFKSVNNGLEALQYLKDMEGECPPQVTCPELILLDLNMPVLDGLEFLDFFNRLNFLGKEDIKIVVLSSSNRVRDVDAAMKLGAVDYLVKPLSTEKIQMVIDKYFSHKE